MATKLQARYNPERYPLLHQWWSELPDGKRSQSLCELLEYALYQQYYGEAAEVSSDITLEETGRIVTSIVDDAVERLMEHLNTLVIKSQPMIPVYYTDESLGKAAREDYEQLQGVLGGAESW